MAIYACSDLHGRIDIYKKICDFLKPDDIIYFLGDANDRSPYGWKLIKEIYNNPQWIYLKGNHEDMLFKAIYEYFDTNYSSLYWYHMVMNNGGYQTFYDALEDPDVQDWLNKINQLPTQAKLETEKGIICLCHSGAFFSTPKEQLWNREHFNNYWAHSDQIFIVHGHTPVPYVKQEIYNYREKKGVLFYANEHKIDIDIGAVWRNEAALLNLNDFKVILIKGEKAI